MKKQSLFLITVVFCLAATLTTDAKASGTASDSSLKAAQFSYSGVKQDQVFFKVNYVNPEAKNFMFEVRDDNGEVLYSQRFTSKNFNKTICIPRIKDKSLVNFSIRSGKTYYGQSFEVEPSTLLVEEYVVTRL